MASESLICSSRQFVPFLLFPFVFIPRAPISPLPRPKRRCLCFHSYSSSCLAHITMKEQFGTNYVAEFGSHCSGKFLSLSLSNIEICYALSCLHFLLPTCSFLDYISTGQRGTRLLVASCIQTTQC